MSAMLKDVRYVARSLAKSPAFTLIGILTLGLGIGVNSTVFSVVNAYLFRPLPVNRPDELVALATKSKNFEFPYALSYLNYKDITDRAEVFSDTIGFSSDVVNMSSAGRPERIFVEMVTGNYFSMLGINAAVGRTFTPDEGRIPGASQVAVLSYEFWQKKFGGDLAVLGRAINLNSKPFTIIGVTPENFSGTDPLLRFAAYVPFGTRPALFPGGADTFTNRGFDALRVIARLKPGLGVEQAGVALNVLASQLEQQYPDTNKDVHFLAVPETRSRPAMEVASMFNNISFIFMALVSLVLLIACVNVANLMLARAISRQKELAIRAALGASRAHIVKLFLTESILIAAGGGIMGLLLAYWAVGFLSGFKLSVVDAPISFSFGLDWRVFTFTLVAVLLAGILSGLLPAIRSGRHDLNDALKEGGRGSTEGGGWSRLRNVLIVGQVAVSVLLLIAAGLFVRSLQGAETADVGFRTSHLLMATMDLGLQGYDQAKGEQFYKQLLERLRTLPGVGSASLTHNAPFGGTNNAAEVIPDENLPTTGQAQEMAFYTSVEPDYFKTMGVALVAGREFTEHDNASAPQVAMISQAMARRYWPGQDALGKRFRFRRDGPYLQVVGITKDEKHLFVGEDFRSFMYLPAAQHYEPEMTLVIYTPGDPAALTSAALNVVQGMDGELPIYGVMTISEHLKNGLAFFFLRAGAAFAGIFGLLALVMASVGIYGVISYSVSRRVHEIGIRMALGAGRWEVLKLILRQGLLIVGVGVLVGIGLALIVTQFLSSLLYGVKAIDPVTFIVVSLLLMVVALLASYIPALRAARVDPMIALRQE